MTTFLSNPGPTPGTSSKKAVPSGVPWAEPQSHRPWSSAASVVKSTSANAPQNHSNRVVGTLLATSSCVLVGQQLAANFDECFWQNGEADAAQACAVQTGAHRSFRQGCFSGWFHGSRKKQCGPRPRAAA